MVAEASTIFTIESKNVIIDTILVDQSLSSSNREY